MLHNKLNDHQFRQILRTITGEATDDPNLETGLDVLRELSAIGKLCLPAESELFLIPERLPIFSDILHPKKSIILNQLFDRNTETAVVADVFLQGKNAIYLVGLVQTRDEIGGWVECMNRELIELTVKPIDEENKVILAPLKSFVVGPDGL